MSTKTALNIPEYEADVKTAVSKVKGGFWTASVNAHGQARTGYYLYTIWNSQKDIKVFYVNFVITSQTTLLEFVTKTEAKITNWGITTTMTLQNGLGKREETVLPFIHMAYHSLNYICKLEIGDGNNKLVHAGDVFEALLPSIIPIHKKVLQIESAVNNFDRSFDTLLGLVYNMVHIEQLVNVATRNMKDSLSPRLIKAYFEIVHFFAQRQNISDETLLNVNSNEIIQRIDELLVILNDPTAMFNLPPTTRTWIPQLLSQYKDILENNKVIPYEAFILSIEYEVSIIFKQSQFPDNHRYLLERIQKGMIYNGNFSFWAGSTKKTVNYVSINIKNYRGKLSAVLPKK